jgi:hypothetical protein
VTLDAGTFLLSGGDGERNQDKYDCQSEIYEGASVSLCDLGVSVVNIFARDFTTETQRTTEAQRVRRRRSFGSIVRLSQALKFHFVIQSAVAVPINRDSAGALQIISRRNQQSSSPRYRAALSRRSH